MSVRHVLSPHDAKQPTYTQASKSMTEMSVNQLKRAHAELIQQVPKTAY